MRSSILRAFNVCAVLPLLLLGCGESGSDPVLYPEVRFQVQPLEGGRAMFEVDQLIAAGVQYTSLDGTPLVTTAIFNVVIEGAAPPYTGTFTQVGDNAIRVRLVFNVGGGNAFQVFGNTIGPGTSVTVSSGQQPPGDPVRPNPEARFDVCSPLTGTSSCSTTADPPGRFGVPFGGTIGDFFTTHVLGQPTAVDPPTASPSIYFLQNPRDQVSGVFRSNDATLLVASLFINGSLVESGSGTEDVVVNTDL
jgi:hypothetical protein